MKKLRKLLSGLMAITTVLSMSFSNVSAIYFSIIGTDKYNEWVASNNYEVHPDRERLLSIPDMYGSCPDDVLYEFDIEDTIERTLYVTERENYVIVTPVSNDFSCYQLYSNADYIPSEEEIETFLSENNFKAQLIEYITTSSEVTPLYIVLDYEKYTTKEEVYAVVDAMEEKFSFMQGDTGVPITSSGKKITFETEEPTTPSYNFGTVTIAGDIDLNNENGISDIVTLAKFNASPELFPITDATALANADMNQDGEVNTLDATILIEMALGTYESAF